MKKDCCVVIITHKEKLEGNDLWSFEKTIRVFSQRRDIKLIIPESISTSFYEHYSDFIDIQKVNPKWLSSLRSYNEMCCTTEFYDMFSEYEYMLICQTDAFVFKDELDYFMGLGYDWYGAPWSHLKDKVGNGGLSLRKVSKMREIVANNRFNHESIGGSEDTWFCINHENEMKICPLDVACNFSIESANNEYLKKIKTIPMGLHGKYVMDLWDEDGTKLKKNVMKSINWKKYFDAIYCLSLADNLKRREFLSDELNRVGILNSGIFHWKITVVNNFYKYIWTNKDFNLNKYWGNVTGNNSALNCSMGHYELYRELQALGYKRVLILEDDVCFLNNLDEICEILEFIPDDYDICLLDKFLCEPLARKEYFNEINKMKVNACFFNYDNIPLSSCGLFAVSEKAINALVEKHENSIEPPDHYTNRITFRNGKPLIYEDGLKRYCSIKNVAIQNANLNPPSKHKHLQIAYQGIINLEEYNYRLGDESNVTEPKNNKKKRQI